MNRLCIFLFVLSAQLAVALPAEFLAHGLLPYHKLTVSDFQVNDQMYDTHEMMTCYFLVPFFKRASKQQGNGFIAYATTWEVLMGFDRNLSARKSWFKDLKGGLLHEQGHLDIAQLFVKKLSAMPLRDLPIGLGATRDAALQDLAAKIDGLIEREQQPLFVEERRYDKDTAGGTSKEKQAHATLAVNARLRAAGITYEVTKK